VAFIAVAGPTGVGKTTVTGALAQRLGFGAWPERVQANPFLERYRRDPAVWAFRSQLAFMLGAVEDAVAIGDGGTGGVLERPVQEMFAIFAAEQLERGELDREEYETLRRVAAAGARLAGEPDVLIVLEGDPQAVVARVRSRARTGERDHMVADARRLAARYERWAAGWDPDRLVRVDAVARDLRLEDELDRLAEETARVLRRAC